MPKRSARSISGERKRLNIHQQAVKEQAIRWIENLDLIISIDYADEGPEVESIVVKGIQKRTR